ncbi:DUF1491 family protein [Microvirga sp. W0021]|uniref:DUF1491 family protein n=1 Tax=Hohaiivirga grylli TaxID=3133970 RepID=A0ABV0BHI2_9HYPH
MPRLTSEFWVSAYIRRCNLEGIPAVLRRRGASEAGAIFIKIDKLDGTGDLFGPVPQSGFDTEATDDRQFSLILEAAASLDIEEKMQREIRFDEDLWWVEIETARDEHFLTVVT